MSRILYTLIGNSTAEMFANTTEVLDTTPTATATIITTLSSNTNGHNKRPTIIIYPTGKLIYKKIDFF